MADEPDILYHYTDQQGFLGITHSRELWATEARYLNDEAEMRHGLGMARRLLCDDVEELVQGQHADVNNLRETAANIEQLIEALFKQLRVFVCSFSAVGDLLSQWTSYTGRTGGVAIGFDVGVLKRLAKANQFELRKCIYSPDSQRKLLEDPIQEVLAADDDGARHALKRLLVELALGLPVLKDSGFSEENEWRLVHPEEPQQQKKSYRFRQGPTCVVPYLPFPLGKGQKVLKRVIIGPSRDRELALAAVQSVLDARGFSKCEVRCSQVPLRY